ncbi:Multidrug resistance-associated protein 4 [Phytophthora fragariae]|nr:Multidrug resistance-associated protein 4 [Phytophthora fragariae]
MPPQHRAADPEPDTVAGVFHELRSPHTTTQNDTPVHEDKASPLDSANLLSVATIWWLQPLLRRGYNAPLTEDSVWELPKKDQSRRLQGRFDDSWTHQARTLIKKKYNRPNVNVALWAATKDKIAVATGLYMLSASLTLLQPFLIKAILESLEGERNLFGISSGYGLAVFLGCVAFCGATAINSAQFLTARAGCNARMVVINSVFQKILRLSATARRTMNSGEVVTLAGVDSERVMEAYTIGLWCLISPVILIAVCILIGTQMDVYVGLAVAVTSVAIMFGAFTTSKHIGIYRRRISTISANRVKLTNEVLLGIRVIKFYAWEDSINDTIREIRGQEVALMRRYNYLRLTNAVLMFLAPTILNMVCFVVYILLGNTLDVATAFVILALTNSCKMAFSIFANASVAVSEAITSTGRLSDFLVAGEVEESAHQLNLEHGKAVVSFQVADFQWVEDSPAPTLSNITFTLQPGTLTVVVGPVGSGKSSLVNAILGEMHQLRGTRQVRGDVAYASQQAWIQNLTVRDNILFGEPYDADHYSRVVTACQLLPDFEMLEQGDQAEIGERGINLSGGQKARVGVARAMYRARKFDFVVLDDPLSALDVHVANAVFSDGLMGIAQGTTRFLVLNSHYHLLQFADRVLVMSEGQIVGDGTLERLKGEFSFLATSPRGKTMDTLEEPEQGEVKQEREQQQPTESALTKDEGGDVKMSKTPKKLIVEEDRRVGSVRMKTYVKYLAASEWNGYILTATILILFTVAQVSLFFCDWFLSQWSKGAVDLSQKNSMAVYVGIVVASLILTFIRCVYYMEICMRCSGKLHFNYIRKVLGAPVTTFFDVTPVGRILNRFSRDLDQVDNPLPYFSLWMMLYIFQMSSAFIVCAAADPYVLILYIPVGYAFMFTIRVYQSSARELKRLDSTSRSPFLNLVSETISGIETVRAYKMVDQFSSHCEALLNNNAKFFLLFQSSSRWFAMRTDWLVSVIIAAVAILAIGTKSSLGAAVAGLGLTYASQLTSSFQRMTTLTTQVENIMTCFERIAHYGSLDEEGYTRTASNKDSLSVDWPRTGAVVFENVSMRYRDDLPLVLKGVSFSVASGEKVGICGRTGSGKSSLMSVLFRVVEIPTTGRVLIDGVDIATITVHQLRTKLTIIPQDPMLFSGSLRMNLDPFAEKSDAELFQVLRKVHLSDTVAAWGKGLDYEVAEKGENLSVGQRQLLCIARALIRDSKVIVMDEATANVDQESDKLIQQTMKESFGGGDSTVLCIAHRIETIMDSDKILVLDAGEVVEFDTPSALLQVKNGVFKSLVSSSKKVLP